MLQIEAMKGLEYHSSLVMTFFLTLPGLLSHWKLLFYYYYFPKFLFGKIIANFTEIGPASFLDIDRTSGAKHQCVSDFPLPSLKSSFYLSVTGTLRFPTSLTPGTCLLNFKVVAIYSC